MIKACSIPASSRGLPFKTSTFPRGKARGGVKNSANTININLVKTFDIGVKKWQRILDISNGRPLIVLAGLPKLLIDPCFTRDFQVTPPGGGICP